MDSAVDHSRQLPQRSQPCGKSGVCKWQPERDHAAKSCRERCDPRLPGEVRHVGSERITDTEHHVFAGKLQSKHILRSE